MPWHLLGYYTALLMALAWCFLGIGMLISTLARSSDVAQGAAFVVWLALLLFLDLILLGIMIQEQLPAESAVRAQDASPSPGERLSGRALSLDQGSGDGRPGFVQSGRDAVAL